jgi:hypothetical protein
MTTQLLHVDTDLAEGARRPRRWSALQPGLLALLSLVLLVGGLIASAALGGVFPSPFGDASAITAYYAAQPDAVVATAVFGFESAVCLAICAAAFAGRLKQLGVTVPAATLGLASGAIAAGMLVLSALLAWVLSRPEIRDQAPLVRAFQDLAFLTGGAAHVVFLGLLFAGVAVSGMRTRLLRRHVTVSGLVIAAAAMLGVVSLIWHQAAFLLPVARFPGLIWLVVAGLQLPTTRGAKRETRHVTE